MKKRNFKEKLNLGKHSVSNLATTQIKGAGTNICSGTQPSCAGCELPTRLGCPRPTRGDWTCDCPQN